MAEFIQNLSAEVWAAIISFLSIYGGTMLAMVIAFIRTRIKNIKLQETIDSMQEFTNEKLNEQLVKTQEMLDVRLAAMEKQVILKITNNEDAREQEIRQAALDFEEAINEVKNSIGE